MPRLPIPSFLSLRVLPFLLALASSTFAQENLLEGLLDPLDDRLPPVIRTDGHREKIAEQVKVEGNTYVFDNENQEGDGLIWFQTKALPELEVGREYLFSVEVNVESMELLSPDGARQSPPAGLRIYFYQSGGDFHENAVITGNGVTGGWVKVVIPVNTEKRPELRNGYVLLTLAQARAKIKVRNFKLEPVGEASSVSPHFVLPDGSEITEQIYRL